MFAASEHLGLNCGLSPSGDVLDADNFGRGRACGSELPRRVRFDVNAFAEGERVERLARSQLERLYEMNPDAYTRRPVVARSVDPLAPFGPAVRAWFEATFEAPTQAQSEGWAAISRGATR